MISRSLKQIVLYWIIIKLGRGILIWVILFLPICSWFFLCWIIMKLGRGIYWFGNLLSGFRLDPFNWTQEV